MAKYNLKLSIDGKNINTVRKFIQKEMPNVEFLLEKIDPNRPRTNNRLAEAESLVEVAKSITEELKEEMCNLYNNLPENLQNSSKGDNIQITIGELDRLLFDLYCIDFSEVDFPAYSGDPADLI